ncbi:hypothetical protein BN1708_019669, partial [Verticillium longisporum]
AQVGERPHLVVPRRAPVHAGRDHVPALQERHAAHRV